MEYVPRSLLWKCVIGNHIDLPPKNVFPPLASPLKKSGAATVSSDTVMHFESNESLILL